MEIKELRDSIDKIDDENLEMLLMDIFNCGSYDIYNFDEILQDINAKCPPIPIFKGNQNVAVKVGEFAFSGGFDITDVGVEGSRSYKFLTVTLLSEQRLKYHRV